MRACSVLLAVALVAVSCGGVATPPRDPIAGEYVAAVSESALPIAQRLTAAFSAQHQGMTWTVKDVGSAALLALVAGGEADAGFLSREITVEDQRQVQAMGIGYTGQVLIVHPSNPISGLSTTQLRGIFSGATQDWSEVGGAAGPILVLLRRDSSPTRTTLDPLLRAVGSAYRTDAVLVSGADAMVNAVSASPRAIGMVSALHLTGLVNGPRPIVVDGVAPTKANVASGSYPYRRPITLVLRVNTSLVRPGAKAFRDWVHGEEGQRLLREIF